MNQNLYELQKLYQELEKMGIIVSEDFDSIFH